MPITDLRMPITELAEQRDEALTAHERTARRGCVTKDTNRPISADRDADPWLPDRRKCLAPVVYTTHAPEGDPRCTCKASAAFELTLFRTTVGMAKILMRLR